MNGEKMGVIDAELYFKLSNDTQAKVDYFMQGFTVQGDEVKSIRTNAEIINAFDKMAWSVASDLGAIRAADFIQSRFGQELIIINVTAERVRNIVNGREL